MVSPLAITWADTLLQDFQHAKLELHPIAPLQTSITECRWRKPLFGDMHFNVDAAFDMQKGDFNVGTIVRNHNREPKTAMAQTIWNPSSVLGEELLVLYRGLSLCIEFDF